MPLETLRTNPSFFMRESGKSQDSCMWLPWEYFFLRERKVLCFYTFPSSKKTRSIPYVVEGSRRAGTFKRYSNIDIIFAFSSCRRLASSLVFRVVKNIYPAIFFLLRKCLQKNFRYETRPQESKNSFPKKYSFRRRNQHGKIFHVCCNSLKNIYVPLDVCMRVQAVLSRI